MFSGEKPKALQDNFDGAYWTGKQEDQARLKTKKRDRAARLSHAPPKGGGGRGHSMGAKSKQARKGGKSKKTKGSKKGSTGKASAVDAPNVEVASAGGGQELPNVVVQKTGSGPMPQAPIYITINVGRG